MSAKNTKSKSAGYKIIALCAAAVILGSFIPLAASARYNNPPKPILIAGETIGALSLAYVFAVYILKR